MAAPQAGFAAAKIGIDLIGGYYASRNAEAVGQFRQEVAEFNAEFAELDAYDAELDGFTQEALYQKIVDSTLSDQRASFAAADVDVNFGTAATVQGETRLQAELNRMEIQKQAREKALGFEREARDLRNQGRNARQQGETQAANIRFQTLKNVSSSVQTYLQDSQ